MATNNNPSAEIRDQPIDVPKGFKNENSAKTQTFQLSDEGSKYRVESSKHLNYNPENKIICRIIQLIYIYILIDLLINKRWQTKHSIYCRLVFGIVKTFLIKT